MSRTIVNQLAAFLLSLYLLPTASAQSDDGFSFLSPAQDSAVSYASKIYRPRSFLRRFFMGSNYRQEWEQTVTVPVFHFSGSGFTVKNLGGGMQTASLHLVDSLGRQWSLRTVNKFVTNEAVSPALRNSFGRGLAQDLISAAFPYAVPLAGELASAVGLSAAKPGVFYVSDDSALGRYRSVFAGSLCTLEERDPGFDSTLNSEELLKNIRGGSKHQVLQEVYLRARLLDMLIADWDRHADNWRWGVKDSAGLRFYYAVPRDRDWAFYKSKGVVPWLAQETGSLPCLVSFTKKLKKVKAQSWKSWEMDKEFTNRLDAGAWESAIRSFAASLRDEVVDKAVKILPASVYETDGNDFAQKLKSRRNGMLKEVMKYYRYLAEAAVVNGSDSDETFAVSAADDGVHVSVYQSSTKRLFYRRRFLSSETRVVTLNGFGGNDVFSIDGDVSSSIRFVLAGGTGRDVYDVKGNVRVSINDAAAEANELINRGKAKLPIQ